MRKRSSNPDVVQNALRVVEQAVGEELHAKNPAAVALGRLGGLAGGKARAKKLSPDERTAIAKKAAKTRWKRAQKRNKIRTGN